MTSEDRFERLTRLYEQAGEVEPERREAFLDEACAGDPELRSMLEHMLAVDEEAPGFLDRPEAPAPPPASEVPRAPDAPVCIGPYRIVRRLGSGGMGVVYEAQQETPARRVALKVLRDGFDSESMVHRFRYEVEVLGRLNHPGIAQVYDAGVDRGPDGVEVPWFALEFVADATDLVSHARRGRLSLGERIELFLAVCDAVHHGHQLGVVHRDLKPANVLVDGEGRPKVIDFGVARAVGEGEARTEATRDGELVGTLPRMAPEQLAGDPALVDTRTDVYGLGLLLFELLCGRLPYDVDERSWTEVLRIIREDAPMSPTRVNPELPRELAWIVLRALEKERERRYASVLEFAADLARFQRDEPVLAGPPSGVYRARKFLRRHRLAVGAATLVVVALAVGTALATRGMLRAIEAEGQAQEDAKRALTAEAQARADAERALAAEEQARGDAQRALTAEAQARDEAQRALAAEQQAQEEATRALAMKDLATGIFHSANFYKDGADVRMLDVLRDASFRGAELDGQPELEVEFRLMLAESLESLGEAERAREQFARVLELCDELYGPDDPLTLRSRRGLALAALRLGERKDAARRYDEVIEHAERVLGPDHEQTLRARGTRLRALVRPGSPGRMEELQALAAAMQATCGADDPQTISLTREFAFELCARQRFTEALARLDALLEELGTRFSTEDPRWIDALYDRAVLRRLTGDLPGAERDFDRLDPLCRSRKGASSVDVGTLTIERVKVKRFLDRDEEAERIVRAELEERQPRTGDADPVTALLLFELGVLLDGRGEHDEAEAVLTRAIEGCSATYGDEDIRTIVTRAALAQLWSRTEREEDAVALLEEVVQDTERAFGPDSRMLVEFLSLLGSQLAEPDPSAALVHAERAARIARATLPPADGARSSALMLHAQLLIESGAHDEAEPVVLEMLDGLPELAARDELRREAWRALAEVHEARGDEANAARYRERLGSK